MFAAAVWSGLCSMETGSVFSVYRALAEPVRMCMFDFSFTILEDLVSSVITLQHVCVNTCVCVSDCVCLCVFVENVHSFGYQPSAD